MNAPATAEIHWWRGSMLAQKGHETSGGVSARIAVLLPFTDRELAARAAQTMAWRAGIQATYIAIEDDSKQGSVALLNAALACIDCEALVYAAQDAFPSRYWLRRAVECLRAEPAKGLLAFNDGKWFGQLAGFGLARRTWLQQVYGGALFYPGYRQHYGDTELSAIAAQHGGLAYDPNALLVEVDAQKDTRSVHPNDRELYAKRVLTGFDGRVSDASILGRFR